MASKPLFQRRPDWAPWNAEIEDSRSSAYCELPSRRREPPEPRGKSGWAVSSAMKAVRRAGEVERERKSLEEKSVELELGFGRDNFRSVELM